jgi:lipopolysaccharide/colanic/teichoic acid biosynthesis glycosyltransferase
MLKRIVDAIVSAIGLIISSPVLLFFAVAVWLQDFRSPFYIADRVGYGGRSFKMVKLRSMVVNADGNGVTSTSDSDSRITLIGKLIRKLKLDEITQLWNVLIGDMSLVGPRPNVARWGVDLYTAEEMHLLSVRPGITDFSSIVFADEGAILSGEKDPDLAYNQLIRPWKSRLSLFYIDRQSIWLDIKLVFITALSIISRGKALKLVERELRRLEAPSELIDVASRKSDLIPCAPPGSTVVISSLPH